MVVEVDEHAESSQPIRKSSLAVRILLDWCEGTISTPTLHAYAKASIADGIESPFLRRLMSIAGSSVGKTSQTNLVKLLLQIMWF